MKRTQAVLMALICAFGFMFSACDVIGNPNGSSSDSSVSGDISSDSSSSSKEDEDSSSMIDSSSKEDSSSADSSSSSDPDPVDPQLSATPIDITNIISDEDGSKLTKGNLGGSITLREKNYDSYGSGWALVDDNADAVQLTNASYAFQDGFVGTNYYLEGVFDSTEPSFMAGRAEKLSTGWAGLLIAHGATKSLAGAGAYKITATIHESNILLQTTPTWSNGGSAVILANWTQMFTKEELAALDLTAVKLGVLRYGENQFAFYVNDRYVASRQMNNVVMASGETEIIAESGIGVMSEKSGGTLNEVISNFKYTAEKTIVDALAALVPEKSVDIYMIAGQSNASGNSTFKEAEMRELSDATYYGNNNVYYIGNPGATKLTLARVGQGDASNKIGPELGIAEALQNATYGSGADEKYLYDATRGTYAAIVKRAVGGSSLMDDCSSDFDKGIGNWAPPTYAASLDKAYDDTSTAPTGKLYRELIQLTVETVKEFQAMGFTTIRIRGLFWMQGERNRGTSSSAYQKVFQNLVVDMRNDLATKVGDIVEQDFKKIGVFVGEISATFDSAVQSTIDYNKAFIATQNEMVLRCSMNASIGSVYIVKSSGYELNKLIDGVDTPCGALKSDGSYDDYHWNSQDMYDIGQLAGKQMGKFTAIRLNYES